MRRRRREINKKETEGDGEASSNRERERERERFGESRPEERCSRWGCCRCQGRCQGVLRHALSHPRAAPSHSSYFLPSRRAHGKDACLSALSLRLVWISRTCGSYSLSRTASFLPILRASGEESLGFALLSAVSIRLCLLPACLAGTLPRGRRWQHGHPGSAALGIYIYIYIYIYTYIYIYIYIYMWRHIAHAGTQHVSCGTSTAHGTFTARLRATARGLDLTLRTRGARGADRHRPSAKAIGLPFGAPNRPARIPGRRAGRPGG